DAVPPVWTTGVDARFGPAAASRAWPNTSAWFTTSGPPVVSAKMVLAVVTVASAVGVTPVTLRPRLYRAPPACPAVAPDPPPTVFRTRVALVRVRLPLRLNTAAPNPLPAVAPGASPPRAVFPASVEL